MKIEEMDKREKVIKGLEQFKSDFKPFCGNIADWKRVDDALALLKDEKEYCDKCAESAIKTTVELQEEIARLRSLLKEQEAKQAIKQIYHVMMNRDYENPVEVTRYDWLCPTCKSLLCRDIDVIDDNYHFCKVCGQAVKWE